MVSDLCVREVASLICRLYLSVATLFKVHLKISVLVFMNKSG